MQNTSITGQASWLIFFQMGIQVHQVQKFSYGPVLANLHSNANGK